MSRFRERLVTVVLGLIVVAPTCCPAQEPQDDEQAVAALRRLGARLSYHYGPITLGVFHWRHPDIFGRHESVFDEENPHRNVVYVDFFSRNGEEAKVKDADLIHLRGLPDLKRVNLWGTKVTDAGLAHLAGLTNLRWLNLSGTRVTDAGLVHLKRLDKLLELDLAGVKTVTGAGLAHLPRSLIVLELQQSGVRDPSIAHLGALIELDLSNTEIGDLGMEHVGKLIRLKRLHLSYTLVSDRGAAHLRNLVNLEFLSLADTRLIEHGTGLDFLADMTAMTVLSLENTGITDAELAHFRKMKHLRTLSLDDNQICGDGLVHLAALEGLEFLCLQGTKLREDTLTHLYGLKKLHNLELPQRKFSRSAVVALDDALPDVVLDPEFYTEDWDREIDRTLLDFSFEPGISRLPRRRITQIRIVMHEMDMSRGLPNRWATRKEQFEFKTDEDLMLRAMEDALTGSLWFGVKLHRGGIPYIFWDKLGEMRVTTTTDEFVIYITAGGFLLDTTYGCWENRFFNWSAAMLIDDILFKQTKKRMPRPLFDHLSGEGIRRAAEKSLEEIRAKLGMLGGDDD